jgi:hypothetical protein
MEYPTQEAARSLVLWLGFDLYPLEAVDHYLAI